MSEVYNITRCQRLIKNNKQSVIAFGVFGLDLHFFLFLSPKALTPNRVGCVVRRLSQCTEVTFYWGFKTCHIIDGWFHRFISLSLICLTGIPWYEEGSKSDQNFWKCVNPFESDTIWFSRRVLWRKNARGSENHFDSVINIALNPTRDTVLYNAWILIQPLCNDEPMKLPSTRRSTSKFNWWVPKSVF